MTEVRLPKLAEGVDSAVVSFWLKDIGEAVAEGDDLVEMLTDKATFNVSAPFSGNLSAKNVEEGQQVRVGDIIAHIEQGIK